MIAMPDAAPPPNVRAVEPGELDLLIRTRARCYAGGYADDAITGESPGERGWLDLDAGDALVAERGGRPVGTLTALTGRMSIRGKTLPCQGVAWVGTTHDARRSGGVANSLMTRCLDIARDRGQVLSALMPFRASFYARFGYGLIERRALWTVPIPLLPSADGGSSFELIDLDDPAQVAAVAACRSRQVDAGHGDVAFGGDLDGFVPWIERVRGEGYLFARTDDAGRVDAFVRTRPVGERGDLGLMCDLIGYESDAGLLDVLRFLSTLRDQYSKVLFATPADVPLNLLLKEPQLPHRGVEHAYAICEVATRTQVRILDHARFFNDTPWPDATSEGVVTVAMREAEGGVSRLKLDVSGGRCEATQTNDSTPDFACDCGTWAAVATGELRASQAVRLGLAEGGQTALLDTLSRGTPPFCREYF